MGYKWWPLRKPSVWAISDCWWRDVVLIFQHHEQQCMLMAQMSCWFFQHQHYPLDQQYMSMAEMLCWLFHQHQYSQSTMSSSKCWWRDFSAAANDRSQSWFFINIIIITLRIWFQKIHYRKKYFQKKYFKEFVFSKIYTFGNHTFGKYIFGKYTFDKFTLIYLDIHKMHQFSSLQLLNNRHLIIDIKWKTLSSYSFSSVCPI